MTGLLNGWSMLLRLCLASMVARESKWQLGWMKKLFESLRCYLALRKGTVVIPVLPVIRLAAAMPAVA